MAPVGYRYRKWCLGNDINLVARTEHDAVQAAPNNELQFINIKVCTLSGNCFMYCICILYATRVTHALMYQAIQNGWM